jgi:hypothetical protein
MNINKEELNMNEEQIKYMVNRFLSWKLPDDFNPDGGVAYTQPNDPTFRPIGTNLLTATQATDMVKYMLEGISDEIK